MESIIFFLKKFDSELLHARSNIKIILEVFLDFVCINDQFKML